MYLLFFPGVRGCCRALCALRGPLRKMLSRGARGGCAWGGCCRTLGRPLGAGPLFSWPGVGLNCVLRGKWAQALPAFQ